MTDHFLVMRDNNDIRTEFKMISLDGKFFIIEDKNTLLKLSNYLNQWLETHNRLQETDYKISMNKMVRPMMVGLSTAPNTINYYTSIPRTTMPSMRSMVPYNLEGNGSTFINKGEMSSLIHNLARHQGEIVEKLPSESILYIGSANGNLITFDVQNREVKETKKILGGEIRQMLITADKDYLFLADEMGHQAKLCLKSQKWTKISKEIHKNIHSIVMTGGGQYVWASTSEVFPLFKVVDFAETKVTPREIGRRNIGGRKRVEGVLCMTTTTDGKWILAGTLDGAIIKISIKDTRKYEFFEELHLSAIICIESLSDYTSIITASQDKHLRIYSIIEKNLVISHDFGAVFDKPISIMKQMDQNNLLFVGNEDGYLKLICLTQNNVIGDLGNFNNVPVTGIAISLDNKKVFIGSSEGHLIEYSVNSSLVKDHGKIVDRIYSMCI